MHKCVDCLSFGMFVNCKIACEEKGEMDILITMNKYFNQIRKEDNHERSG